MDPFLDKYISESVLRKLIKQNIVVDLHPQSAEGDKQYIYREGIPADYFVLILQGNPLLSMCILISIREALVWSVHFVTFISFLSELNVNIATCISFVVNSLPDYKMIDLSKSKAFAEKKINWTSTLKFFFYKRTENIV